MLEVGAVCGVAVGQSARSPVPAARPSRCLYITRFSGRTGIYEVYVVVGRVFAKRSPAHARLRRCEKPLPPVLAQRSLTRLSSARVGHVGEIHGVRGYVSYFTRSRRYMLSSLNPSHSH